MQAESIAAPADQTQPQGQAQSRFRGKIHKNPMI
jgi:hypothetical protein